VNEAEVVDMRGHVGKKFGDPATGLAVARKFPKGFHDALFGWFAFAAVGDGARVVEIEHLTVGIEEGGLVIESVEMAWAALHEDENDAVGFWFEVRGFGRKRVDGGRSVA
jgi:hypothetical protein